MPTALAKSKLPPVAVAALLAPMVIAALEMPPVAVAALLLPRAIARSEVPEVAVALPNLEQFEPVSRDGHVRNWQRRIGRGQQIERTPAAEQAGSPASAAVEQILLQGLQRPRVGGLGARVGPRTRFEGLHKLGMKRRRLGADRLKLLAVAGKQRRDGRRYLIATAAITLVVEAVTGQALRCIYRPSRPIKRERSGFRAAIRSTCWSYVESTSLPPKTGSHSGITVMLANLT